MLRTLTNFLKWLASQFPERVQHVLKRAHYRRQIRRRVFGSEEPEFNRLKEWVREGDWVLDVGANVGHYALKLTELVGPTGRLIALEPVPATFKLLTANAAHFATRNVSLLNVAASDSTREVTMRIPEFGTRLPNFYRAHLTDETSGLRVLCLAIDSLNLGTRIALVKIDVEDHELAVLKGMVNLIRRNRPVLIVEGRSEAVADFLRDFGYTFEQAADSPNRVYTSVRLRLSPRPSEEDPRRRTSLPNSRR